VTVRSKGGGEFKEGRVTPGSCHRDQELRPGETKNEESNFGPQKEDCDFKDEGLPMDVS